MEHKLIFYVGLTMSLGVILGSQVHTWMDIIQTVLFIGGIEMLIYVFVENIIK